MWNRRLGKSFGMKENFEYKMLRRGAAEVLPGKSSPAELDQETRGLTNMRVEEVRSQAMGHVNGTIYEKSYRNQVVKTDIVSAFLYLHNVARSKLTSKSFAAKSFWTSTRRQNKHWISGHRRE